MSPGGKERLAVGRKCEGVNVPGVACELSLLLSRGHVPLANDGVLSTNGQASAIRGDSNCGNFPNCLNLAKLLFVDYIPDCDAFESCRRQEPAVWRKGEGIKSRILTQILKRLTRRRVPESNHLVGAGGHQRPAIGREGQAIGGLILSPHPHRPQAGDRASRQRVSV